MVSYLPMYVIHRRNRPQGSTVGTATSVNSIMCGSFMFRVSISIIDHRSSQPKKIKICTPARTRRRLRRRLIKRAHVQQIVLRHAAPARIRVLDALAPRARAAQGRLQRRPPVVDGQVVARVAPRGAAARTAAAATRRQPRTCRRARACGVDRPRSLFLRCRASLRVQPRDLQHDVVIRSFFTVV